MQVEHFLKISPIDITCWLLYNFSMSFSRVDATRMVNQIIASRSYDSLLFQRVSK